MASRAYTIGHNGSATYRTSDGDMVDQIAFGFYGKHVGNTEAVLSANRGLAGYGPVLPAGLVIKLPAKTSQASASQAVSTVSLWD